MFCGDPASLTALLVKKVCSKHPVMKNLYVFLVLAISVVQANAQKQTEVTPVSGDSWISHLHRPLENTSMGKTGLLGPPSPLRVSDELAERSFQDLGIDATKRETLHGADLFRLNCQGCHGESGLGVPPEINSVIEPTRATSAAYIMDRMRKRGMDTNRAQATEMANQAKGAILQRLHVGGVDMPPFPHLNDAEVRAIFAYLRQLSEIPGAENQQVSVDEPSVRVGEHIVKSTCHICHTAMGVNPSSDELMQGAIPPLSSLTARVNLRQFERKVRHGAPIMMGTPQLPYRGRMPVFEYLSESEVADAYMYLRMFPPSAKTDTDDKSSHVQLASQVERLAPGEEPPTGTPHSAKAAPRQARAQKTLLLPVAAGVVVVLLIVGGVVFTVYDVKRSKPRPIRLHAAESANVSSAILEIRAKRIPEDPDKQAAWRSRFERTEHDLFESTWFSPELEKEDGVA